MKWSWTDLVKKFSPYVFLAVLAFWVADLLLLSQREKLLPTENSLVGGGRNRTLAQLTSRSEYDRILNRNPFNSDGKIPDPIRSKAGPGGAIAPDGEPVPTTLTQLTLVGTLVHVNSRRSVATLEIKGGAAPKVLPFFVGDDMEGLGELTKVQRKKAIFRNYQSGRLEYVEIKDDSLITFGKKSEASVDAEDGKVVQQGNQFFLKRSDLNQYLQNVDKILQQATAIPNIVPNSGGQIDGFRLIDIQAGSLYEKLGLKKGDVIKGVNGQAVNSPNKALELYNQLKGSNNITIDMDRGGAPETFSYQVKE